MTADSSHTGHDNRTGPDNHTGYGGEARDDDQTEGGKVLRRDHGGAAL